VRFLATRRNTWIMAIVRRDRVRRGAAQSGLARHRDPTGILALISLSAGSASASRHPLDGAGRVRARSAGQLGRATSGPTHAPLVMRRTCSISRLTNPLDNAVSHGLRDDATHEL
jgi:hypothetical protein